MSNKNTHKHTGENIMNNMFKTPEDFLKTLQSFTPQVTVNKNGYEIRTKILELAQAHMWNDYHSKWGQFELTVKKDGDEVVATTEFPTVPGADKVLETAQKFYDFVNQTGSKM